MTSSRPLRKTGTDLERMLLSAGAAERPDPGSVRRAAKVLGIVPRAALVAATLGIALRATRWTSVAAWTGLPLAGIAGVALVAHLSSPATREVAPVAAVQSPAQAATPAMLPVLETPAAPIEPSGTPVATASTATLARIPARRAGAVSGTRADGLREQAAALDGARELLASGQPNAVLARLDEYDHRFAGGPLHEESQLLRIEALAHQGDHGAAASLARHFLKTYPASVHVDRVAAILQSMTP